MVHVAEEVVFLRLHVRRIVQRIAHQRRRFAQGQGKQALAVAIQVLVHRVAAGQRSGDEEHAAAPGDVFLQGLDAQRSILLQLLTQIMAKSASGRFGADK